MLNKVGENIREICCFFIGFYSMAVVLIYASDTNQSLMSVLNSIGIFLSSIGVIVAILTIYQQHYLHRSKELKEAIDASNSLMFKLGNMINVYGQAKANLEDVSTYSGDAIRLLDGKPSRWEVAIDFERIIFISEIKPETDVNLYVDIYHAVFNYNIFLENVFRWQANQPKHSSQQNIKHLADRIEQLETFGSHLADLHSRLFKVLKKQYPNDSFFSLDLPLSEFSDLERPKLLS